MSGLVAFVAEHRMNAVVEPWGHTRVKCDGDSCDFYAEGLRYWDVVKRHDEHFAEALAVRGVTADEGVVRFAEWVATNRAYNGSDHQHGQALYNECLNAVLGTWAREWLSEAAGADLSASDAIPRVPGPSSDGEAHT